LATIFKAYSSTLLFFRFYSSFSLPNMINLLLKHFNFIPFRTISQELMLNAKKQQAFHSLLFFTICTNLRMVIFVRLPYCSLSCESRMRSGLTLILSHFFAASRASLLDLFIQLCASLTAQAIMSKL
jgi:hypothetical protein